MNMNMNMRIAHNTDAVFCAS